jgi:ATP-binding cassette subfamily F protein uup
MPLVQCDRLSLAYGTDTILNQVSLQIEKGERLCLVGRNGSGKSTFLRILAGELTADDGSLWRMEGLRIALLPQDLPGKDAQTVYQAIAGGLQAQGQLLARYRDLSEHLEDRRDSEELTRLHQQIEIEDGWSLHRKIETIMTRLQLPADRLMHELSGGWLRRVALAKAMVNEPDLLLLDEPTNHLDIPMIHWLEKQLKEFKGTLLFVTHDRALIQTLASAIVELDRGTMTVWRDDYQTYVKKRDLRREVETRQQAESDKKLAREERWIRQGIKARRSRNEGRVKALQNMRSERRRRLDISVAVKMETDSGESSGKLVRELSDVTHSYDSNPLIRDLDLTILRGDRIGIIGANGTGKSTLLRIIIGELHPQYGRVRSGTRLQVAYFDQLREQLEPDRDVVYNLSQGREFLEINDRSIHVVGYLSKFLFSPARIRTPVRALSGGERNRLLLARLFSKPTNLLVLDEPTNDLDVETLELLEELLIDYEGTVLLVSHDRAFLDNVVTSTLVFEEGGRVQEFVGGYQDWLRQGGGFVDPFAREKVKTPEQLSGIAAHKRARQARKNDQRLKKEMESIPDRIETLEDELNKLHRQMSEADFYSVDNQDRESTLARAVAVEQELAETYQRWEELDSS